MSQYKGGTRFIIHDAVGMEVDAETATPEARPISSAYRSV
jgi:hypothetical protein